MKICPVPITECKDCYYLLLTDTGYRCSVTNNLIWDQATIPDNCPLDDYEGPTCL